MIWSYHFTGNEQEVLGEAVAEQIVPRLWFFFICRYMACVVISMIIVKMICPCPMVHSSVSHSLEIAGKWRKTVMKGKYNFFSYFLSLRKYPFNCFDYLLLCNIWVAYMRLFFSWIGSSKISHTTGKHCTGQRVATNFLFIYIHTQGIRLWGSSKCGHSLWLTLKTPGAGRRCWGTVRADCCQGQGDKYDKTAKRMVASPARAHPTLCKQGRPKGGSQGWPRVHITTQVGSDKMVWGPRSSWEVNPLVRVKFNESNEG